VQYVAFELGKIQRECREAPEIKIVQSYVTRNRTDFSLFNIRGRFDKAG
jgi:hypothetical protein